VVGRDAVRHHGLREQQGGESLDALLAEEEPDTPADLDDEDPRSSPATRMWPTRT
jgi:hypothetical protein